MMFGEKEGTTKCGRPFYYSSSVAFWERVTCNDCRRVGHLKLISGLW